MSLRKDSSFEAKKSLETESSDGNPLDDDVQEIVPRVFVGTLYLGVKRAILRGKEITHIIGVNDNKENLFPDFRYLHLDMKNNQTMDLRATIKKTFDFISKALDRGDEYKRDARVLISCPDGRTFSPIIAIAYMMKKGRISMEQAYEHCTFQMESFSINQNFLHQLKFYELSNYYAGPQKKFKSFYQLKKERTKKRLEREAKRKSRKKRRRLRKNRKKGKGRDKSPENRPKGDSLIGIRELEDIADPDTAATKAKLIKKRKKRQRSARKHYFLGARSPENGTKSPTSPRKLPIQNLIDAELKLKIERIKNGGRTPSPEPVSPNTLRKNTEVDKAVKSKMRKFGLGKKLRGFGKKVMLRNKVKSSLFALKTMLKTQKGQETEAQKALREKWEARVFSPIQTKFLRVQKRLEKMTFDKLPVVIPYSGGLKRLGYDAEKEKRPTMTEQEYIKQQAAHQLHRKIKKNPAFLAQTNYEQFWQKFVKEEHAIKSFRARKQQDYEKKVRNTVKRKLY